MNITLFPPATPALSLLSLRRRRVHLQQAPGSDGFGGMAALITPGAIVGKPTNELNEGLLAKAALMAPTARKPCA